MPRQSGSTRSAIERAAARQFSESGYVRTSVRSIAAEVGVDAALVIRHFGSKERLFLETMRLELDFHAVLDSPLEGLGERLVGYLLDAGDDVRGPFLALVRASDADGVESALRSAHEDDFVAPLRARLAGDDAELRARLVAAAVAGLLYSLWVVADEAVLAAGRDALVREYGAMVQILLTPLR
jgi:AcrR family transcriptional regulator